MGFGLKKTVPYSLFFLFFWLAAFPPFADGGKGRESESDGKALFHPGQWGFDDGGSIIFEQPDKSDFFSQRVVDGKIESYWIFQ